MTNQEKLTNAIKKKIQELYRIYNPKVVKTWSESQKYEMELKEWYKIYGMIEALEIITGEEYVIDGDEIMIKEERK